MNNKFDFFPITTSDFTKDEFKSSMEEDLKGYVKKHSAKTYGKEEIERMNKEWRGKNERESLDRYK